ncbi:hypothetical protein MITS9509_02407 [Synechococcus sp. MIT S9509]|nr:MULTISPECIES: dehydrogenase [unclassified Synechococcus]KZR85320.1 hypothetical protein MITS9504_02226 [Synechococcus sp. MIT S9504]KZR91471.1 hypothetical protein MITS9509_02407 [Synechococcus sp. MIT S9509]
MLNLMRRIAWLLGGCLLFALPVSGAGLMELLDSMKPARPERSTLQLPSLPLTPGRGKNWVGDRMPREGTSILVLAGHADSQRMYGSGTPGWAVGVAGAAPMQAGMTDELYWNLRTARAVVAEGKKQGLNISFYDPGVRTIRNVQDPRTNWSVGQQHASEGGYVVEIHYDAYSPHGIGAGIIPAVAFGFSVMDEALAKEFGAYPYDYRGMLGAPRRGVSMLEIGMLEGALERGLRDPRQRKLTLDRIAKRVVTALREGLEQGTSLRAICAPTTGIAAYCR